MDVVKPESLHYGRRDKGIALVLVMLIVVILTISGTTLLYMSYHSRLQAIHMGNETASRVLTDSGLSRAIGTLNAQYRGGTLDDGDLPTSIGETVQGMTGTFSYQVTKDANGLYVVTSVGTQGDFQRIEVAKLQLQNATYFDHAILTKGGTNIRGNLYGFNPDDPNAAPGTYPVTVGSLSTTNPAIALDGTVYGDAYCAVGEDPESLIVGIDNLTGSAYALTEEPEIITPTMPTGLTSYGPYTVNGTVTFTPSDSGLYDNLAVGGSDTLIIDGGTVTIGINNLLQLGVNSEIVVNEGSTLLLYLESSISSMNGASISYNSETIDPSHIQIYGTGTTNCTYALKSKDVFQGVIYAPYAQVSILNASEIAGAIVANSFSGGPGIEFLYDTSLSTSSDIALNGGGNGFAVNRWSESVSSEIPEWAQ